ncbi:hypothetical protein GPJ56_006123 [Histomonas meleagridis]|uniref:uncharacterized protein n=1 Tax=Histomonas meleagridis TaxID=135588 RepID=UPI00355A85D6|nr:hypothetical protein GPJ56_006123 [Histomonas meleagridis]KAH0797062.1 hypothetical protein GO595_010955 [Histomonas meleagridis]
MTAVSKLEQDEKAYPPIDVTESGILMLKIFGHNANAEPPISFTFSPMTAVSKLEQNEKAYPPIDVTESPTYTWLRSGHSLNSPDDTETLPMIIT